jgi:hypothetical protein
MAEKADLAQFEFGVDTVQRTLIYGDSSQISQGLEALSAATAAVKSPEDGYQYADEGDFFFSRQGMEPHDAFKIWRRLAFMGVPNALTQARHLAGVTGDSELKLNNGLNIADSRVGGQMIGLVEAGDNAAIPLAHEYFDSTLTNGDLIYWRTRQALRMYRAGDAEALGLAINATADAKAFRGPNLETREYAQVDIALWGLVDRMVVRRDLARVEEVVNHIEAPQYKLRVAAELYKAGHELGATIVRDAIELSDQFEQLPYSQFDAINDLVAAGYPEGLEAYRQMFLRNNLLDETSEAAMGLAAMHKGGDPDARERLLGLRDKQEPLDMLNALHTAGLTDDQYDLAAKLYKANPSRGPLKHMLMAKFETTKWRELWDLPLDMYASGPGWEIYPRANDVLELAEHIAGKKLPYSKQD